MGLHSTAWRTVIVTLGTPMYGLREFMRKNSEEELGDVYVLCSQGESMATTYIHRTTFLNPLRRELVELSVI